MYLELRKNSATRNKIFVMREIGCTPSSWFFQNCKAKFERRVDVLWSIRAKCSSTKEKPKFHVHKNYLQ